MASSDIVFVGVFLKILPYKPVVNSRNISTLIINLSKIFYPHFYLPIQRRLSLEKSNAAAKKISSNFSNATCHANGRLTQILLTELKYPNELSGVSHAGGGLLVWKVIYKRQG